MLFDKLGKRDKMFKGLQEIKPLDASYVGF